ncbi:Gluconolactonase [Luteitalea pratensis]|uniref:Gluconolactonase n=1 Tax=Luteitalea pratensis TaxID=1855912 RepID=A0A143PIA4_LUTPR|nr:superoxide dismutase [Luteitalea pratensis]AMY08146.1 Gluconolactonase [Luteitalea pratensis]
MSNGSGFRKSGVWSAAARALFGSLLLVATLPLAASGPAFPPLIALPAGFAPEGIATGRGSSFYAGDLNTGRLLRGDYRSGTVEELAASPAPGAQAVGLEIDKRTNALFVAASTFGARVYDAETGALLESYPFATTGPNPVLANDVEITRDAAYFTDSCSATLYKLPLGPGGRLPAPSAVEAIPVTGDFTFVFVPAPPGYPCGLPNMNGIVASDDGRWLIIGNTVTSELFRVNPVTGESVKIALLDAPFSSPFTDGLLLHGSTLYSVENFPNRIAVIELSDDRLTGTIERYVTSPNFDVPSTAAFFGESIYAINARFRFDGSTPPQRDDDIVRVSR